MSPHDPTIDTLVELVGLKEVARAGWVRRGLPDVESVAAHSWGVAALVLLTLPGDLDRGRALAYAVLHDVGEVRVGDLTPHDGVEAWDKAAREARAVDDLLPPALAAMWHAYERQDDPEARFVRQLDRLDMAIQAVRYHDAHGVDLSEFLASAARVIDHPALTPLLAALRRRHAGGPS